MEFNKYKEHGAYHWRLYESNPIYQSHVLKVAEWVRKGKTLDIGAGDGLITFILGARFRCTSIETIMDHVRMYATFTKK